jgi:formylglycine-generating enzyme required for sulfatase activity
MGDHFGEGYPDDGELPVHEVELSPFLIDPTPVTNAQFAAFVKATGWVTEAEQLGVSAVFHLAYRGAPDHLLHAVAGTPWWLAVRGAD